MIQLETSPRASSWKNSENVDGATFIMLVSARRWTLLETRLVTHSTIPRMCWSLVMTLMPVNDDAVSTWQPACDSLQRTLKSPSSRQKLLPSASTIRTCLHAWRTVLTLNVIFCLELPSSPPTSVKRLPLNSVLESMLGESRTATLRTLAERYRHRRYLRVTFFLRR